MHGRRGRPITDHDAHEINRVEELSYDLKTRDVMITALRTASLFSKDRNRKIFY